MQTQKYRKRKENNNLKQAIGEEKCFGYELQEYKTLSIHDMHHILVLEQTSVTIHLLIPISTSTEYLNTEIKKQHTHMKAFKN